MTKSARRPTNFSVKNDLCGIKRKKKLVDMRKGLELLKDDRIDEEGC
jgi:hypothetical protein